MKHTAKFWGIFALVALMSACQGSKEVKVVPAELAPLTPSIQVTKAWSTNLGGSGKTGQPGLAPAGNGARVFAAASDGKVVSLDAVTGKQQWSRKLGKDKRISGGPGIGANLVVVGTAEGEVIALSAADGSERWSVNVSSAVLSAPAVSVNAVVVRTIDGQLTALDSSDGDQLWRVDRRVQGLTLRGHSTPVMAANAVVSGFDNGKLAAIDVKTGAVLWERSVSERRGRNEFERLADVDGKIAINGEDAFVVGFQGRAMLIALPTGQPVWAQDMSSSHPVAIDWNQVFIANADDEVVALDRRNGVLSWKQDVFDNRELSAPSLLGTSVVVGDFEGYMHWMSALDGSLQARTRAGSSAISSPPLVMGDMIYVQNEKGELHAFTKPATVSTQ